jgi:hypothetical protein
VSHAASHIAPPIGLSEMLAFDMGSTTAKVCLISSADPELPTEFEAARVYRLPPGRSAGIPRIGVELCPPMSTSVGRSKYKGRGADDRACNAPGRSLVRFHGAFRNFCRAILCLSVASKASCRLLNRCGFPSSGCPSSRTKRANSTPPIMTNAVGGG